MGLLIQNGTVVTAEKAFPADILVDGETIKKFAKEFLLPPPTKRWMQAACCFSPGE